MKCYYEVKEGEWVKGFVQQLGQTSVHFYPEANPTPDNTVTLHCRPEITFLARSLQVTGFRPAAGDRGKYELFTVYVSPGWVKPK